VSAVEIFAESFLKPGGREKFSQANAFDVSQSPWNGRIRFAWWHARVLRSQCAWLRQDLGKGAGSV